MPLGRLEGPLEGLWGELGHLLGCLGESLGRLGAPLGPSGRPSRKKGPRVRDLTHFWRGLGTLFGYLGASLEDFLAQGGAEGRGEGKKRQKGKFVVSVHDLYQISRVRSGWVRCFLFLSGQIWPEKARAGQAMSRSRSRSGQVRPDLRLTGRSLSVQEGEGLTRLIRICPSPASKMGGADLRHGPLLVLLGCFG